MRCLGLMSGTSADGVDAVLADFDGPPRRPRWRLIRHHHHPYPAALRQRIVLAGQGEPISAAAWLELAEAITEEQAAAAQACDPNRESTLVGCHGQTLWHRPPQQPPPQQQRRGASWQVLQGPLLAQLLNRPVVHDFRAADLALGGQGAPLVPRADAALIGSSGGWRALLNLGGIANLTLIPPASGAERHADVLGWDCGPANSLIDLAMTRFSDGAAGFDKDGAWAAQGKVRDDWIARWLQEPYFLKPFPKSTGREAFGAADLTRRMAQLGQQPKRDVVATLTAFSAAVVAQDLQRLRLDRGICPIELITAGGGDRNPVLIQELRQRCRGQSVRSINGLHIAAEAREALVFALLAWWHSKGIPANAPAITGAARHAVLGVMVRPA